MASSASHNSAAFSIDEITRATGGDARGCVGLQASGVFTDTRSPIAGGVFVALRGERFDAHDFLPAAKAGGAAVLVVERGRSAPSGAPVVEVDDTSRALGDLAAAHRRRSSAAALAITGSVGKTSVKNLVGAICRQVAPTLVTEGNLNNQVGLPLTIFQLSPEHRFAVLELGTSSPGEIARLAGIALPDVAIITCIGSSHLEGLGSIEGVQAEKGALFAALGTRGIGVVNALDPRVLAEAARLTRERKITYGTEDADVRLRSTHDQGPEGAAIVLDTPRGRVEARLRLVGAHQVSNALGATAAALALGIEPAAIAAGIESVRPASGRMAPVAARCGALVLDDTYNANPESMRAAFETLASLASASRRLVVLGEMLELGSESRAAHRALGELVARIGVRGLVACGPSAKDVADSAVAGGLDARSVSTFESSGAAAGEIGPMVRPDDVVLVKGSRGMRMERVVQALTEEAA
ncbi:MAG: UDP-N-acetylmuramoyl-tripeptide--D-alanyl-D-alanine ligase [Deltaproteobacteria bacterium]|nr:UDP-N-acetylmuramoyl-tripeptide--D-alanyl-D-alanine ligase [Deltaproteobacteria bacterium]